MLILVFALVFIVTFIFAVKEAKKRGLLWFDKLKKEVEIVSDFPTIDVDSEESEESEESEDEEYISEMPTESASPISQEYDLEDTTYSESFEPYTNVEDFTYF